jgi:hypothetical protein
MGTCAGCDRVLEIHSVCTGGDCADHEIKAMAKGGAKGVTPTGIMTLHGIYL